MHSLIRILFILFVAVVPALSQAAGQLVLDDSLQRQELAPYLFALEEPAGGMDIEEARRQFAAGRFVPTDSKNSFNKGYTRSAWWIAFEVRAPAENPQTHSNWLLELAYPALDLVELYRPGTDSPIRAGDTLPFSERPMRHVNFVFPMAPPSPVGETIFLRVQSQGTLLVPLVAWAPDAFAASSRLTYAGQAAYFGAVLAMLIYNALLWLSLRERVYLDYVLYVTFIGLGIGAASGMTAEFFWPDSGWLVNYSYWAFGFAGIFVTRFARSFLRTATTSIWLDRSLLVAGLLVAVPTFIGLFVSYYVGGRLVSGALFIALLVSAWSGIYSVMRKIPGGRLYLLSWFLFLAFASMFPLRNYGLVPNNFFTAHGIQFGSLAEMMLLSFALAARINSIRAEKEKAQQAAIAAHAELVVNLRESEQILETRVAERTEQLEQANCRLNALSITDGLTGLANRRQFDAVLSDEWKRMQRLGQPLALAMIDIDWFKKYNDHYGHQAGDVCLVAVADVLAANIGRTGDLVARYGGEEFVFIAPATRAADALSMAEKVCEALALKMLPHAQSQFGHVTASIGVASIIPLAVDDAALLLKHADEALYQAKASGRNKAVLYQAGATA
jgi:diguanylate cyclase (GGDEF)-like protein